MSKKKQTVLGDVVQQMSKFEGLSIEEEIEKTAKANRKTKDYPTEQVHKIDPEKVCNWSKSDRQEFELGDLEAFADELKNTGQIQPVIVRPYSGKDKEYDFELIAGERRWRAASKAGIKLLALVKEIDDKEAEIIQIIENKRTQISDYSKGLNVERILKEKVLNQNDLAKLYGISQPAISGLLAFTDIPRELLNAIADLSKVSYRTAILLRSLSKKSNKHIEALIFMAKDIQGGAGATSINRKISYLLNKSSLKNSETKTVIISNRGQALTWEIKKDKISLGFSPKTLREIDLASLEKVIVHEISGQLFKREEKKKIIS